MKPIVSSSKGTAGSASDAHPAVRANASGSPSVPAKWAWHYRTLLALRERLLVDRAHQREDAAEPVEPHSMDLADSASDEFDHAMVLRGLSAGQDLLVEVNEALQRILDGTYGICLQTGRPIPRDRLRAVPWTSFSLSVERRLESDGARETSHLGALRSVRGALTGDIEESEVDVDEKPEVRAEDESLREFIPPTDAMSAPAVAKKPRTSKAVGGSRLARRRS